MVKYRDRLLGRSSGASLVDPTLPWEALEPKHVRALWRRMAARYVESRGREFGMRAAEGVVDALYSVAAWLREEHHIPPDAARPPEYWRKRLKDEWTQRTGKHRSKPRRPRHTPDEYRRIFATVSDPRVDPRMRLAIELAAECRTGQVLRCTRTMLTLTEVDSTEYAALPAGSLGQVVIPGAGKKHGEVLVFTPEQRRAVDDALCGYLANYEAAWRTSEIADYYLFPGSRMRMMDETGRQWKRRVRDGVKPLSRDGARVAFQELEKIAGVPHLPGRRWYGLRRIATDLAETATADDRVKDRLGGWQDSETRKHIYQDRETERLRVEAASVRRQIRLGAVASQATPGTAPSTASSKSPTAGAGPALDPDALVATLTPEQRELLAARLSAPKLASAAPTAAPDDKTPGPQAPRRSAT